MESRQAVFGGFEAPRWVCWLAQDSNGNWWGYSVEPHRNDTGWYENEVGDYILLGRTPPDGWQTSLRRVDDGSMASRSPSGSESDTKASKHEKHHGFED